MIVWGWWTRGAAALGVQQSTQGPQWVHLTRGRHVRVKPIEVKPTPVEWGTTEED